MVSYRRKLQLVGGTTFSVSLPKDWVMQQRLRVSDEVVFTTRADKQLLLGVKEFVSQRPDEVSLDVTSHIHVIDQLVHALYYLGVETIHLVCPGGFERPVRFRIRRAVSDLSGAEIVHEQEDKLSVKVWLDKAKIDIFQLLYRLHVIIDASLDVLMTTASLADITFYEQEVDRLYHLAAKLMTSSLTDGELLRSSQIGNVMLIPPLFLLAKRLENISDNIEYLAKHVAESPDFDVGSLQEVVSLLRALLAKSSRHLLRRHKDKSFMPVSVDERAKVEEVIAKVDDGITRTRLWELLRFVLNVHEELVSLVFYTSLEKQN